MLKLPFADNAEVIVLQAKNSKGEGQVKTNLLSSTAPVPIPCLFQANFAFQGWEGPM